MHIKSSCKFPVSLSDFKHTWTWLTDCSKNSQYMITQKSVQCKPNRSTWTEGQTNITKPIVAFRYYFAPDKRVLSSATVRVTLFLCLGME